MENINTTATAAAPVSALVKMSCTTAQKIEYRSTVSTKAAELGEKLTGLYTSKRVIDLEIKDTTIEQIMETESKILNYLTGCTEGTCFAVRMPMKKERGVQIEKNITIAQAIKMTEHMFVVLAATGDPMAKTGCDIMADAIIEGELKGLCHSQKMTRASAYFIDRAARADRAEAARSLKINSENKAVLAAGMADEFAALGRTKSALAEVARLNAAQAKLNMKVMDATIELELARIA